MTVESRPSAGNTLRGFGLSIGLGLSSFACLVLSAGSVAAQTASDSATAQALFDHAKALMSEGTYAEACSALEESQRIESRSGTLLNLADCYEHVGRLASAWSTFVEAATLAKTTGNAEREIGARDRAAKLAPRLSNLVIEAPLAEFTPGLEISRDGQLIGSAQWGLPLPADSGTHTITATAPARKTWRTQVIIKNDASTTNVGVPDLESETVPQTVLPNSATVLAAVVPATSAAPPPAPSDQGTANRSKPNSGIITAGVVTGVLVAGTAVTGILYGVKLHDYNTANDQLAPNRADLHSQTIALGVANLALLGGAAVAAGVTVFLWTRASSPEPKPSASLELRGMAAPARVGLTLGGTW